MKTTSGYQAILREHFEARKRRNPAYSLRSFARDLDWSPSRLSEAMSGKAGLSTAKAKCIAEKLSLSAYEQELFTVMVTERHGRTLLQRKNAKSAIKKLQKDIGVVVLPTDAFKVIRDWFHFAIVELLKVRGFTPNPAWISNKLGISPHTASDALKRLQQVGLLQIVEGQVRASSDRNAVVTNAPSEAVREFHTQILNKAIDSIHGQPRDVRNITASIVAIDKADLPKISSRIQEFRRQLALEFGTNHIKDATKDSLYCISVQCFSLEQGIADDQLS